MTHDTRMPHRIAINGYGRVGRNILRALYETGRRDAFEVVAINDLGDAGTSAHLTRHDSVHGRFDGEVRVEGDSLVINGDPVRVLCEADPARLPWAELQVDLVMECSGRFTSKASAGAHLQAGARKVLISAPGGDDVDATVVFGVNHDVLGPEHQVISNASCTTNCLAPLIKPLHDAIGVERGVMTTVHAYTNDQVLIDGYHKDLRRARSATQSMIPTKTGAAVAVGLVLPDLAGRLDGFAVRVPTVNVSLVDLSFDAARETSVEEVDRVLRDAAAGDLHGILAVCDEPLVSMDFNHHPASAIHDPSMTRVVDGRLVKVCAWYDNEWGFSCRMLDTAGALLRAG